MEHRLVSALEKALGWSGSGELGAGFRRGSLDDEELGSRLLTPQRLLDLVMRRVLAPPQLRCFQLGRELHPDRYLARVVTRRGQALSMVDTDRLGVLLVEGATVVLDALDVFDPTMEVACRALQWWSREIVQVNTYLSSGDADGFSLHWDDHDVLVVQLAGEKAWQVRGESRSAPMYRDVEENVKAPREVVWEGRIGPGEVLHIPRGHWHQATRSGLGPGYSLHITFGFVRRTGVDWLAWVADRARVDERFRRDLNRDTSSQSEDQMVEMAAGVAGLLSSYPIPAYLAARERERPAGRHVRTHGIFSPPDAVVCVTAFPPEIRAGGAAIEVYAAGKKLTFATRAEPALRLLLSGLPVTLTEVSAQTGVAAERLAEVLLEEGVCAELTEALSWAYTGMTPTRGCWNTP